MMKDICGDVPPHAPLWGAGIFRAVFRWVRPLSRTSHRLHSFVPSGHFALAAVPGRLPNIPECLHRAPMIVLQPASTTPEPTKKPTARAAMLGTQRIRDISVLRASVVPLELPAPYYPPRHPRRPHIAPVHTGPGGPHESSRWEARASGRTHRFAVIPQFRAPARAHELHALDPHQSPLPHRLVHKGSAQPYRCLVAAPTPPVARRLHQIAGWSADLHWRCGRPCSLPRRFEGDALHG